MKETFSGRDITVVIPAHNSEAFISEAIDSVARQTTMPFEVLVVENASSDRTADVVKALQQRHVLPIRLVQTKCPGLSNARNIGFSLAKTPLIAMLDADDIYAVDFLTLALSAFNNAEDISLFFGNRLAFDENGKRGSAFLENTPAISLAYTEIAPKIRKIEGDLFPCLLRGNFVSCSGTVLKRDKAYQAGLFPTGVNTICEDRKFFAILSLIGNAAYTLETVHYYRLHGASITGKADWRKIKRNGVSALIAIRTDFDAKMYGKTRASQLEKCFFEEVGALLYAGSDDGWNALISEKKWLKDKGVAYKCPFVFYIKAVKNTKLLSSDRKKGN